MLRGQTQDDLRAPDVDLDDLEDLADDILQPDRRGQVIDRVALADEEAHQPFIEDRVAEIRQPAIIAVRPEVMLLIPEDGVEGQDLVATVQEEVRKMRA